MDEQQPLRDEEVVVPAGGATVAGHLTVPPQPRGGRPDLAGAWLARVEAPTLLIVGGRDETVLGLNQQAAQAITAECRIVVIPGATHLFEEAGALEQVAVLARDWFCDHLRPIEPQS